MSVERGPTSDYEGPLLVEPADECPRSCSKCDEAFYLVTPPDEKGYQWNRGYIRAGNSRDENHGLAVAIAHRFVNWDALCDERDHHRTSLRRLVNVLANYKKLPSAEHAIAVALGSLENREPWLFEAAE